MLTNVGLIYGFVLGVLLFFLMFNYNSFVSGGLWGVSNFFLDSFSYYFVVLTSLVIMFVLVLGVGTTPVYGFLSVGLFVVLVLFFFTSQAFYFFVFFELSFVFVFLMLVLWGVNPERLEALNYFMVYSLVGSLPLLSCIIFIQEGCSSMGLFSWMVGLLAYGTVAHNDDNLGSVLVSELNEGGYWWSDSEDSVWSFFFSNQVVFIFWVVVFLFKFPAFGVHLWLPKAHVESPVFGSMLLAGIMIKLGVVGIYRFQSSGKSLFFDYPVVNTFFFYFCFGLVMVNLICSRQYDLKAFVAYSSIVHMSLVLITIWSGSYMAAVGALFLSFSHGLCSSALFMNLNSFYVMSGSRNVVVNSGVIYFFPMLCMFWFVFCSMNCSIPISLNFFSEVLLIFSGIGFGFWSVMVFLFNVFFCGLYCLVLYLFVSHGKSNVVVNFVGGFRQSYVYFLLLWYHFFLLYFYFLGFNSLGGLS
uniref:NADH-ubiquinone oxidoreductase chain 4 n=1 Tax=Diversibipalium mayottensis TaxID=3348909 RepID=A0A8K1XUG2_9PLAT|nr:NADH dehydrogenase subunit 4 [Diversibipalium sp. MNHN JL281]